VADKQRRSLRALCESQWDPPANWIITLLLAHDFGFLSLEEHKGCMQELTRIRKMLAALLVTLESGSKQKAAGA
jgi:hypothetical protein